MALILSSIAYFNYFKLPNRFNLFYYSIPWKCEAMLETVVIYSIN